jgi:hypothetical protein
MTPRKPGMRDELAFADSLSRECSHFSNLNPPPPLLAIHINKTVKS